MPSETVTIRRTTGVGWCSSHVGELFELQRGLELMGGITERLDKNGALRLEEQVYNRPGQL